jgi:hypothetical protein
MASSNEDDNESGSDRIILVYHRLKKRSWDNVSRELGLLALQVCAF